MAAVAALRIVDRYLGFEVELFPQRDSFWRVVFAAGVDLQLIKAEAAKIKDSDPDVRMAAWQSAGKVGAAGVKPLATLMATGSLPASLRKAPTPRAP